MQVFHVIDPKEVTKFAKAEASKKGFLYKRHSILVGGDGSVFVKIILMDDKKQSMGFIKRDWFK